MHYILYNCIIVTHLQVKIDISTPTEIWEVTSLLQMSSLSIRITFVKLILDRL